MSSRRKLAIFGIAIIVLSILYSIIWLSCSDRIITYFGGNEFSYPSFPKIGNGVYIEIPRKYETGYHIKAILNPFYNDSLKFNWWNEYHVQQWLPSHETGYTKNTTVHYADPFTKDEHYSSKVLTQEAPAYLFCIISINKLLEGKSGNLHIYADSILIANYNLNIIQPESKSFKVYCALRTTFHVCLILLGSIILICILIYCYSEGSTLIRIILIVSIFLIPLFFIVTNPGKKSFETHIRLINNQMKGESNFELVRIDNYLFFSIAKVKVIVFKEGSNSEVSRMEEKNYIGFFGGVNP